LDDPLSALDPEVAALLFTECIVDLMKGKTRIIVTNQIQFLPSVDKVVVLRKGAIVEQGTYHALVAEQSSEINRMLSGSASGVSSRKKDDITTLDTKKTQELSASTPVAPAQNDTLMTKEERNIGAVSLSVYQSYIKAGGGYWMFAAVYFGFILSTTNSLATTSWIAYWTADATYDNHSQAFYLGIYFMFAVSLGIFTFLRAYFLAAFGVKASGTLHKNLLDSILRAPQSFFDTTPLGRIISRFSKDLYQIDLELVDFFDMFLFLSLNVVVSLGTILFVTPWFGVAILPLGFVYFRILNYFRPVARETKRLDSIARSPVYSSFSEVRFAVKPTDSVEVCLLMKFANTFITIIYLL
jgi:ABC-type multidrug transport system fused ATPase/permease subunit